MAQQQVAGPRGLPIIGNLRQFASPDRIHQLLDWQATYGETIRLKLFNRDAYVLTNPDDVYQILVKNANKVEKSPRIRHTLRSAVGDGLILSEGDFHKRQRRLTQPAFHVQRIANYADTIVDYGQQLAESWTDHQQTNLHDDMMMVTMQIIAKVLFDADVSKDAHALGEAITVGIEAAMHKVTHLLYVPEWIPTAFNRRTRAATELLEDTILNIINERRQTMEDKGDLLSMLLLSEDEEGERMTDKQVRDEAMTLFVAGHETTANALTWTFYLLAQHPDIQNKLLDEIDTVLGKRHATLDDLKQLSYTEKVIKESMRLYPPAWIMSRYVTSPIELQAYRAEVGNVLLISPYLVHRNTNLWDNPDEFNPDRFTPEQEKARHKFAYFPFGGGPRVCIGNHFAMMEAQLLLATLLQHFTAELVPNTKITLEPVITLRPKEGMPMILHQRHEETD